MKKIAIDNLIDMSDSRYSLVTIISRRARQIIDGQETLVETNTIKPVAVAIEEFYAKKYEAIYNLDQYSKAQISELSKQEEPELEELEELEESAETEESESAEIEK